MHKHNELFSSVVWEVHILTLLTCNLLAVFSNYTVHINDK